MSLVILYFGFMREALNLESETISLDCLMNPTFAQLLGHVTGIHPELKESIKCCMISLNEEYVIDFERELRDGDEVGFIPPVSGG